MTPKEKALQLCDSLYQYLPLERYVTTTDGDLSWEYDGWENARQCALIAVDEIIDNNNKIPGNADGLHTDANSKFWQEVKQEIKKL
jgi:hypothetical protein